MNQSNMTNLITLLLLLCIALVALAGVELVLPRLRDEGFVEHPSRFDKLLVLMCTAACCIAIYSSEYENWVFINALLVCVLLLNIYGGDR